MSRKDRAELEKKKKKEEKEGNETSKIQRSKGIKKNKEINGQTPDSKKNEIQENKDSKTVHETEKKLEPKVI